MTEITLAPRPTAREATRHPITIDEVLALQAAGALKGKRTQLLDGEIHEMPADGLRHIHYAMEIARAFSGLPRQRYFIGIQTTLHLSRYNGPSPDVYVLSPGPLVRETPAERILLVVEVAVSSLADDLSDSAARYARHGVEEYWVVDVENRRTYVHTRPQEGVYPAPAQVSFEQPLAPSRIEGFALRLADFDPPGGFADSD